MKYDSREVRALYERGENVMAWMRARDNNSATAIMYSYDVQAGSYVALLQDPRQVELKAAVGRRLAPFIDECAPQSMLEAGIGEATTLAPVLAACTRPPSQVFGFDLSLSRLLVARSHLADFGRSATLFTGDLERIPFADATFDLVMTFHAIEPNRGREKEVLGELLRVAARRLILVEPSYELGSKEARSRIDRLGYVRGLPETLASLGHPPALVECFGLDVNPLNPAALIVIDKKGQRKFQPQFISPISSQPLKKRSDCWFCQEDGHAFPIISGIPCLTVESAILASKLDQF